jgi:hypothetical protein
MSPAFKESLILIENFFLADQTCKTIPATVKNIKYDFGSPSPPICSSFTQG